MSFGFIVFRDLIPLDMCRIVSDSFRMLRDHERYHNRDTSEDTPYVIGNRFEWYSFIPCEVLLENLTPFVEEVVQQKLYPTYSFTRIYYNNNVMYPHLDTPRCEYSITASLDYKGSSWPIWIEDYTGKHHEIELKPGDALIYEGHKLKHWRTPFEGEEQIQTFLHYVDAEGPNSKLKYDSRPYLGHGR